MVTKARKEKDEIEAKLIVTKLAVKRLEMKIRKTEVQHKIDMDRNAQLIK